MSITSIQLSLLIGKSVPTPAPQELMTALQSVEITQSETSGFQMSFLAQRSPQLSLDYSLLNSTLLLPGNRVVISVTLQAKPQVLMDGIITHQQFAPTNNGAMQLSVTGQDISLLMDLYEIPTEYPGMGDAAIALFVLARYAAYGVTPIIIPPLTNEIPLPIERIPQQNSSDLRYLQALAAEHNHIFFIKPGPVPLQNTAYWGPVNRVGLPQKALTVDAGSQTNVESLSFSYDGLAPTQVFGAVSDETTETVLPVLTLTSTRLPPLSSLPALIVNQPLVRKQLLDYQGSDYLDALVRAQAITDQSVASVVTANGTLDVVRYGAILSAPGIVGVRGVGFSYDGLYYVKSVTHQLRQGQYTQNFSLAREGLGSTTPRVIP